MTASRTTDAPGSPSALGLVCLGGLLLVSLAALLVQAVRPVPWELAGLRFDRLTAALALLVSVVGLATYRFSLRYLDGEKAHGIFLRRLFFTILAAWVFMLASHLLLLFAAWFATSFFLHGLLTHYRDRPEASRAAWTKFAFSRLGDGLLLLAIGLMVGFSGNWHLYAFLDFAAPYWLIEIITLLLVGAALTKSAQVPFHSWLPETLEAPTPVSALMHAGIINAGGALLLRFTPLLAQVPEALLLLVGIGTVTLLVGALTMMAQVKAKRILAWSTVSQMGFMMVQLGLGVFPTAVLHLLGHGCYKAFAFLRVGELPTVVAPTEGSPVRRLILLGLGTLSAVPLLVGAGALVGLSFWNHGGELALSAIVALALGQLVVGLLATRFSVAGVLAALATQALAALGAMALYQGAMLFFAPVLGVGLAPAGSLSPLAAGAAVVAIYVLTIAHMLMPVLYQSRWGRAYATHALHGFYLGSWTTGRMTPAPIRRPTPAPRQEVAHA
jgi:NAD(P)H-quinone oxidoreductase subunit 5